MCGIVGAWFKKEPHDLSKRLESALSTIAHRGPNDKGNAISPIGDGVLALGHTRLSIIDLSAGGHQPMSSSDKRFHIVFNGEIYNYRELREELRILGYSFKTDSDTEVLLYSWIHWGESCLKRLVGMFAFVVYDRQLNILFCVRDAFGIKPLFYSTSSDRFIFASEIKALLTLSAEKPKIDWQRSYDYLVFSDYDSSDRSFFDGINHLLPGHIVSLNLNMGILSTPRKWWTPSLLQTSNLSFEEAAESLRIRFLDNVRLHLRSDVPLGVALSGGVDSSSIACAVRQIEKDIPIHTFSYIARGSEVDEERWVDIVNSHIGAISHKVIVSPYEMVRDLDDMIKMQGEPFGSTSIYAQYRVFKLTKENGVTVVLDGQGADELLAGYNGYPGWRLLSMFEKGEFSEISSFIRNWASFPGRKKYQAVRHLITLLLPSLILSKGRETMGKRSMPSWLSGNILKDAGVNVQASPSHRLRDNKGRRLMEELYRQLTKNGLTSLLRHGDRNSMRFSIESRVPFLTTETAEFLLSLPEEYLISAKGETKSIFKAAMRGTVPDQILDRKDKIGFQTPEKEWIKLLSPQVKEWLNLSIDIPFLDQSKLITEFDLIVSGKKPFSFQTWRWINYIKWVEQM